MSAVDGRLSVLRRLHPVSHGDQGIRAVRPPAALRRGADIEGRFGQSDERTGVDGNRIGRLPGTVLGAGARGRGADDGTVVLLRPLHEVFNWCRSQNLGPMPRSCQWLHGDGPVRDSDKCGAPTATGKPYCPVHLARSILRKPTGTAPHT